MRKTIWVALIAAASLTGCKKSPPPPPTSTKAGDAVDLKLKGFAGAGATDCGRLDVSAANERLTGAINCATKAAQEKRAFYVAYDMPGMSTGVAGDSQGKLFAVQSEGVGPGARLAFAPCPGELRVAKSGRMTCLTPGTMGLNPASGDPHSGIAMNPAGGQNGMGIPQPMTPSPFPSKPTQK